MKILIIEDEARSFTRLKKLLLNLNPNFEVRGPVRGVEEAIEELRQRRDYQLLFADICLNDGLSFEIFNQEQLEMPVIFTTAYDEYALQAFRCNGIDYLLKPIDPQDLQCAVKKAVRFSGGRNRVQSVYRKRFLVPEGDRFRIIPVDDISHVSIRDNVTKAFLYDGSSVLLPLTMKDLETQFDPNVFFRVSRQDIIHVDSIKSLSNYFNSRLVLKLKGCPHTEIIVSADRSVLLKKWLDR